MEINENVNRRPATLRVQSITRSYFNIAVPVITIILLITYLILSLLPGKPSVDPDSSKKLMNIVLSLAPIMEQWNQTRN